MCAMPEPKQQIPLLDLSGLNCPLPVLKTKAALARMRPGERLRVRVTHPDSVREFEALCRGGEAEMLDFEQDDQGYAYLLRKRG